MATLREMQQFFNAQTPEDIDFRQPTRRSTNNELLNFFGVNEPLSEDMVELDNEPDFKEDFLDTIKGSITDREEDYFMDTPTSDPSVKTLEFVPSTIPGKIEDYFFAPEDRRPYQRRNQMRDAPINNNQPNEFLRQLSAVLSRG
jgi:hypothetical protein